MNWFTTGVLYDRVHNIIVQNVTFSCHGLEIKLLLYLTVTTCVDVVHKLSTLVIP